MTYGIINHFKAQPGQRDRALTLMSPEGATMAGCHSFVMALDLNDPDAFYLTEVWESKEAWQASLEAPGVKESLDELMPLIADWGTEIVTEPVIGIGSTFGLAKVTGLA